MIVFINGQFVEEEKASLRINDLSIQRGYAAFDFFRTRNYIPLFLDDYLERFFNSLDGMHLTSPYSKKELTAIIDELINKSFLPDVGIRLLVTGGYSSDGYEISAPNFIISQHKIQLTGAAKFHNGIKIITHEYLRDLPEVKSINYLMGVWLQKEINEKNAVDVLYHKQGIVSEFPRANIFIVDGDDTLVTPDENILPGITRKKLIEVAKKKINIELRPLGLDEVKNAAEVFMTSTTKRLLPVTTIDETVISGGKAGPVTTMLNEAFLEMEEEYISSSV